MGTFSRSFRTLLVTIVAGGVAVGVCLAALIPGTVELATAHHYTADSVVNLRRLAQQSTVYAADGTKMADLGVQQREVVTFDEIPKSLIKAVIAIEDQSFWENDGIDLGAVARAFVTNLTSGEIEQGGSTITQQLVKNRVLTPKRDVNRKIREIQDALRLNEKYTKEKILTEYLNTVYLGANLYGIKTAAKGYFLAADPGAAYPRGKNLDELTLGEGALLAGLIQNPEGYNPFRFPDRAIRRRADVLRAQVDLGQITQEQADAANREPLPEVPPPAELRPTNYLVAEVQDRLLADPRLGATLKERKDALLKGGLTITTTFDLGLQAMAKQAVETTMPQKGSDWTASLVAIDPATGAVRAMVGGPDFADSQYNIATHPIGRQAGSTWKVITLATALSNGYSPNDTVNGTSPCSVKRFGPQNFTRNAETGGGNMSLWSATQGSVNCAFVRLSTSVGQDKVIDMAHRMGITQQTLQQILTLTLGTIEATPLEMATVIATVASGGVHHTPYFVQKVVTPEGQVLIDESTATGERALDESVANCEQNMLRRVVTGGTGTNAQVPGHDVFGKTGTTDNKSDAWFLGATPQLATAVWFGNRFGYVPGAGFGGDSAAPIFSAFMKAALADKPNVPLPPEGLVCALPGRQVNEDGGRTVRPQVILPPPEVTVTPPTTVAPPAAPTDPAATTPPDEQ
jgi:membrane peptidoglycan carboxypeptidase